MVSQFGLLLRRLRQDAKLTLEELSAASGVSARAISDMERGRSRGPQRRTVDALADALKLDDDRRTALTDAAQAGRPRPTGPAPGSCELPRGVGDFTGRAAELSLLRRLAEQAGAPAANVATVSGTGGLGKTALAVHAAEHLADLFPDGRYYLDLRGMDATPLHPMVALSRLLKALGVPENRIPGDEEERAGHYRALLRRRRCLIVLDNVAHESQARPLLPPEGAGMAIVTSRRTLAGLEGVRQIPLAPLSGEETVGLLRTIVGEERSGSDAAGLTRLAELSGYLPLAVRIVGNRLQSRPGWTPSQLAGRLDDEERRLEALAVGDLAVAAAFALSYEQLSGRARLVFRRLALAAAPDFGVALTAILSETEPDEADDALEELVELGLLQSPYVARYRFHDLVRLFARAQLAKEESIEAQHAARRRMESWLLEVAVLAGRWFEPGYGEPPPGWRSLVTLDSREEASDWLQTEGTAWLEALRSAARQGEHATVVEVAESMHWFSDQWMYWGHWREIFELSSGAARAMGDQLQESIHLGYLSWALVYCEGRVAEGEAAALRAVDLAQAAGDVRHQGWALLYAAWAIQDDRARQESALDHLRRSAELLRLAGDLEGYPQAMTTIMVALGRLGRLEEMVEHSLAYLAVLRDPAYGGDPAITSYSIGVTLHNLGAAYLKLERWDEAIDVIHEALPELSAHPIALVLGHAHHNLGVALTKTSRVEEARETLEEARRILEAAGETEVVAQVIQELADLPERVGRLPGSC
ncbi:helix-turn-helix domain-containing protein [Nonomuraea sp. NPDC050556]|uniref:helix-turn-helix domain-containing protein n=1 Tax=Nonomuraea sp. NPDC050556 TaxID=3364369 RepID=UPI0037AF9BA2